MREPRLSFRITSACRPLHTAIMPSSAAPIESHPRWGWCKKILRTRCSLAFAGSRSIRCPCKDKVFEGRIMSSLSHIKVSVAGMASSECNWTEKCVDLAYRFELPVHAVHSTRQSCHRRPLPLKVTPGGVAHHHAATRSRLAGQLSYYPRQAALCRCPTVAPSCDEPRFRQPFESRRC